jgi:hypothetical protein
MVAAPALHAVQQNIHGVPSELARAGPHFVAQGCPHMNELRDGAQTKRAAGSHGAGRFIKNLRRQGRSAKPATPGSPR